MLVVAMMLGWLVQHGTDEIRELLVTSLALVEQPEAGRALQLLQEGSTLALLLSLALGVGVLFVGVSAAGQGGLHLATKTLKPKWSRLNPLQGAKRLFGPHALWEGAKILVKSAVVALLVWRGSRS